MHCIRSLKSFVRNSCFSISWTNSYESSSTSLMILFFWTALDRHTLWKYPLVSRLPPSIVHAVTLSLPSAPERVSAWVSERLSEADLEGASLDFAWAFSRWMYHQNVVHEYEPPFLEYAECLLWIFYHRLHLHSLTEDGLCMLGLFNTFMPNIECKEFCTSCRFFSFWGRGYASEAQMFHVDVPFYLAASKQCLRSSICASRLASGSCSLCLPWRNSFKNERWF